MELHSYAKHRAVKKWSLEQKRRLVEARILCDEIFKIKPKTSLLPWKKVISQAKLDDFNAVFVRKQWANMVAKYMQYKQDRLGNRPTHDIDAETVNKITQEWEFFQPIHRYMTRKTTNLHSYALKTAEEKNDEETVVTLQQTLEPTAALQIEHQQQQMSTSSNERLNVCSSDTNEDYTACGRHVVPTLPDLPNTDHDFYSKKFEQQHCYFADVEEDTLESITMDVAAATTIFNGADIQHTQEFEVNGEETKRNATENVLLDKQIDIKQEQSPLEKNNHRESGASNAATRDHRKIVLSERDKYYRHKRRFNHRMERRFDAVLHVIGQIAKAEYPSVDVSALREAGNGLLSNFLSSDSEEENFENDASN